MKPTLALGIDTSTAWGSLGLVDDTGLVASTTLRSMRGKGHGLLARIEALLADCGRKARDLTVIGVANGPGSFTSLRVGVTVAQGLGFGLGIPVVPCNTLLAVALGIPPMEGVLMVLVPARHGEVFAQSFGSIAGRDWNPQGVIHCLPVEELSGIAPAPVLLAGPGASVYGEELAALFGLRAAFAPHTLRYSRGESLASWAHEKTLEGGKGYPADKVPIHYLQSHGALTIEEREAKRK